MAKTDYKSRALAAEKDREALIATLDWAWRVFSVLNRAFTPRTSCKRMVAIRRRAKKVRA
jgi:hypothetical protein